MIILFLFIIFYYKFFSEIIDLTYDACINE